MREIQIAGFTLQVGIKPTPITSAPDEAGFVWACVISPKGEILDIIGSMHGKWAFKTIRRRIESGKYNEQAIELGELFIQEIDWKAVHIGYAKEYLQAFQELLAESSQQYREDSTGKRYLSEKKIIPLEWDNMESPKYYNFETDCIYAKVDIDDLQYMLDAIPKDVWIEFVKEQCTSRSGFISFNSPDYSTWDKDLKTWGEARLGMITECYAICLLEQEGKDINDATTSWELMEAMQCNGGIEELIYSNASVKFKDYADSLRKYS